MENVLFAKYEHQIISDIMVMNGRFATNDFIFTTLFGDVDGDQHASYNILDNGEPQEMSTEETTRDGLFDDDQLFLIFENDDIKKVIDKLKESLK